MASCKMCGKSVTWALIRYKAIDCKSGVRYDICKECSINGNGKAVTLDPKTGKLVFVELAEADIRRKCNVCGKIFCFTQFDLDKNKQQAKQAMWSAIGGLGGAMSGRTATAAIQQGNAQNNLNQIVDYSKCPNCGSVNLRNLSKEEYENEMKQNNNNNSAPSTADELKKFKELLDLGVITQEEFNAKKKELLGL